MADTKKDFQVLEVPEANLTEFEKKIRSNDPDAINLVNKFAVNNRAVTPETDDVVAQTLKNLEHTSVKNLINKAPTKPAEAQNVDFNSLPEDKKRQVLDFLSKAADGPTQPTDKKQNAQMPPAPKLSIEPDKQPEEVSEVKCPNCGWEVDHSIGEPTKDDKRNWLKAILSNKPFEKTYELFNGQLSVRFRSRTVQDQQLIHEQLINETANGSIPDKPPHLALASHGLRMRQLSLAASYVQNSSMTKPLPMVGSEEAKKMYATYINEKNNVVAAAYLAIFSDWSEPLFNSVMKLMVDFDTLCFRLMDASVASDFWKETAG
jgi:hypothetical protein